MFTGMVNVSRKGTAPRNFGHAGEGGWESAKLRAKHDLEAHQNPKLRAKHDLEAQNPKCYGAHFRKSRFLY